MTGRTYTLAEVRELLAAAESRRRAEAGDRAMLVKRLGEIRASPWEQVFVAEFLAGKVKRPRGGQANDDLRVRKMQAASFYILLTAAIGLRRQAAEGRLADFFGVADATVHDWIAGEKKRLGEAAWQAKLRSAPANFALDRAMYMENERLAELLKSVE